MADNDDDNLKTMMHLEQIGQVQVVLWEEPGIGRFYYAVELVSLEKEKAGHPYKARVDCFSVKSASWILVEYLSKLPESILIQLWEHHMGRSVPHPS